MDPNKCQVYTISGTQCKTKHKANSQYCGAHENKRDEMGPHRFARKQLEIRHKFEIRTQDKDFNTRRDHAELNNTEREVRDINNEWILAKAQMVVRHSNEYNDLVNTQEAEIAANGGRDPDEMANIRREINAERGNVMRIINNVIRIINALERERNWAILAIRNQYIAQLATVSQRVAGLIVLHQNNEVLNARLVHVSRSIQVATDRFQARILQEQEDGIVQGWGGQGQVAPVPAHLRAGARAMALPNPNVLARIANDNQNVHTTLVVEETKKSIAEILKIPVPEEYRWNTTKLSQTYIQIIALCCPSPKSTWQFSSMYCSDDTIYDMEPGIFGKVVDGVWQYIRSSPHKEDLEKILTAELRDNVGMCAQGNLSRLCNVLQGYLDGIGQPEWINIILGRKFGKLMELENEVEREARGAAILRENGVPDGEWENWLEPLRA